MLDNPNRIHPLANVFALLADQESENASTIAGLDTTDVKPKVDKDKKKKMKYARGGGKVKVDNPGKVKEDTSGKVKEKNPDDGEWDFGGNVVDAERSYYGHPHNGLSNAYVNGNGNQYGRNHGPLYVNGSGNRRTWQVKGSAGDGQAVGSVQQNKYYDNHQQCKRCARVTEIEADQEFEDDEAKAPDGGNQKQEADNSPVAEEVKASDGDNQDRKAVDKQSNEIQGEVSGGTKVLTKEEAERREKRLSRQEEIKREKAMKTLKEYEEQKAKQKAEKEASLSVSEPRVREVTLDKDLESMQVISKEKKGNIDTKQKSKTETMKKDSNIDKSAKLRKKMSIEEFRKLPTGNEEVQGGPGSDRSEDSMKNTNGGGRSRGEISRNYEKSNIGGTRRGRGNSRDSRNYENINHGGNGRGRSNSRDFRNNRAPDLSMSLFPDLAEALKPRKDL